MKNLLKSAFVFLLLGGLVLLISCSGCKNEEEEKAVKELKFDNKKKFKIVQFTDIHYIPGNESSNESLSLLSEIIDEEKPDLVVITGDLIWGEPAMQCLDEVLAPIVEREVPWTYVFGNHDAEKDMTRDSIMTYVMQKPYCYAQKGSVNLSGIGNYMIELKANNSDSIKSVLYFFDSGDYSKLEDKYTNNEKVGTYAWFAFDQIAWYRQNSEEYTKANSHTPIPSLAFFHIPLPEYTTMSQKGNVVGSKNENECAGALNSGMYTAMRECGDVMGTFVGHDHDNDYIGVYHDIALAYGRYSGGKTVYNNLGLNGCRVIELTEGERSFTSYIRLSGGEKIHQVTYPDTFRILGVTQKDTK